VLALIQRVTQASVVVDEQVVGAIGLGLMALIGVERDDDGACAKRLAERVCGYRVFEDNAGRMNRSVTDVGGGLLLVPQFTLPADTRKGMRPGLSLAAKPAVGERLFTRFVEEVRARGHQPQTGRFRTHMQVSLTNDGPATFMLAARPTAKV